MSFFFRSCGWQYSEEVEHHQLSDSIDSLHTPESGRTTRIGVYDISMDIDSEIPQSKAANLALSVTGTSYTTHRDRSRRIDTSEISVMLPARDARIGTRILYNPGQHPSHRGR